MWLEQDENLCAKDRRIVMTKWAGEAWKELSKGMNLFTKLFQVFKRNIFSRLYCQTLTLSFLKRNFDILSCDVVVYARLKDNYSDGYTTVGLVVTESDYNSIEFCLNTEAHYIRA